MIEVVQTHQISNETSLDEALIEHKLNSGESVVVQFSDTIYSDVILSKLNKLSEKYSEDFGIRFYGHYGKTFDCSVVDKLPNVKALSIDCIISADNIEALTKLENLKRFSFGVFETKETELLSAKSFQEVEELSIFETKTKAFNLEYLKNYRNLKKLIVAGHTKNIEAIGDVKKIKSLNLNGISKVPLAFVNRLTELDTLRIILGGRENIDEINGKGIKNLEIIWVRGFNDFKKISRFQEIETLKIEDQIRLSEVSFDAVMPKLEDVKILNCKTLSSVKGLNYLPELKGFRVYKAALDFKEFIQQPLPPKLKVLAFYTAKLGLDKQIKAELASIGYKEFSN